MNRVVKRSGDDNAEFDQAEKKSRYDQPSKVVFARNLPKDIMESELMALCCAFDNVERIYIHYDKGQAFIQLNAVDRAVALVNFYKAAPPIIRNKTLHFEFSSRDEVKLHNKDSNESAGAPNKILLVTVSSVVYDVNVDILYQVFSKHGNVLKIVAFWKKDSLKALIEMDTIESAIACQSALNGRNIYTGCNSLRVLFSRHDELSVRVNNAMSRDFTKVSEQMPSAVGVPDVSILGTGPPPIYPMPADPYRAVQSQYRDESNSGHQYGISNHNTDYGRGGHVYGRQQPASSVVICSYLDETRVGPDALFTLFGCYGDVLRVKILFKKRDTALIQYSDPYQASLAVENLNNVTLYGRKLRVNISKHLEISPVRPGSTSEFDLKHTKEYLNSKRHRFRNRSYKNISSPSCHLHLSNIPESLHQDQRRLIDLFSHQGKVVNFAFFDGDHKMALVQMESIEDALAALIAFDNYEVDGRYIRVSFARSKIRNDPPKAT